MESKIPATERTWFDLDTGVLGTDGSVDSSITAYADGWYKLPITNAMRSAEYPILWQAINKIVSIEIRKRFMLLPN